jgi:general L-amino acid transport system permease protein
MPDLVAGHAGGTLEVPLSQRVDDDLMTVVPIGRQSCRPPHRQVVSVDCNLQRSDLAKQPGPLRVDVQPVVKAPVERCRFRPEPRGPHLGKDRLRFPEVFITEMRRREPKRLGLQQKTQLHHILEIIAAERSDANALVEPLNRESLGDELHEGFADRDARNAKLLRNFILMQTLIRTEKPGKHGLPQRLGDCFRQPLLALQMALCQSTERTMHNIPPCFPIMLNVFIFALRSSPLSAERQIWELSLRKFETLTARTARGLRATSINSAATRGVLIQTVALIVVGVIVWYFVANVARNLDQRGIATGFSFLNREAGIPIAEAVIPYSPRDSYGFALLIGILNTLKVASIGIVLATILGTIIGLARLSKNWLLARVSAVYVEVLRDIPLLLQLVFWYALLQGLPAARQALNPIPGVFLSNRGLMLPKLDVGLAHIVILALAAAGAILTIGLYRRRQTTPRSALLVGIISIATPICLWSYLGLAVAVEWPVLQGFNFRNGLSLSPELFALLFGLVTYTSAFIAEIVRSGILAVGKGQWEAGRALGLSEGAIMRRVVLPQASVLIIPPLTSQFLNLTKNSSLAVAIGYQDIVSIANTTLNQTGQAIEGIGIIMAVYLSISLTISLLMNWYNARVALVER